MKVVHVLIIFNKHRVYTGSRYLRQTGVDFSVKLFRGALNSNVFLKIPKSTV